MHILAEITPLDPVPVPMRLAISSDRPTIGGDYLILPRPLSLARQTLRVSSIDHRAVNGLNDVRWWPAMSKKPSLGIRLFDGDFSNSVDPGQASFDLQMSGLERLDPLVRRYGWAGAKVTLYAGNSGQAWPWATVFKGAVDRFSIARDTLSLTATVDTEPFNADILTAEYAGTSGIEGGADLKGRPKPWAFGAPKNIEPVLIDAVNSVYQVSAYGAIKAVDVLYERGSAFGVSTGNYADYAALVAANIPAGGWGTCLASGIIRLGAPPYGVITADIQGDYLGSVWRRLPGAILQRVAAAAGIDAGLIDTTSLGALDTALSALPGGGNISLFLTEQESVMSLAQRLAITCNAQAGVSWLGKLFASRLSFVSPALTLDSQGRQRPAVIDAVESDVSPPYKRIAMGGLRCWRVHSFDEIAFQAALVDRGQYNSVVVYREGDIVTLLNGSKWIFIGPTPLAGSYPSTGNANWGLMADPVDPASIGSVPASSIASTIKTGGGIQPGQVDTPAILDNAVTGGLRATGSSLSNPSNTYVTAGSVTVTPSSPQATILILALCIGYSRGTSGGITVPLPYQIRILNTAINDVMANQDPSNTASASTMLMDTVTGLTGATTFTLQWRAVGASSTGAVLDLWRLVAIELKK